MSGQDDLERRVGDDRRTFVKKMVVGTAFAAPIISSFSLHGMQAVHAQTPGASAGNESTGGTPVTTTSTRGTTTTTTTTTTIEQED